MKHLAKVLLTAVALVSAALAATVPVPNSTDPDFSFIMVPDTQFYSKSYPSIYNAQMQWIVDNAAALNIKFVVGLGDIVDGGGTQSQWINADGAVQILDGASPAIPYIMALGNHDYGNPLPDRSNLTFFNQYFGPSRYAGKPWTVLQKDTGTNANMYTELEFTSGSTTYLIVALEFMPRQTSMNWARQVMEAHPNDVVIFTTHAYMFQDFPTGSNDRIAKCDAWDAESFSLGNDLDGDEMFPQVMTEPNLWMVLSAHVVKTGTWAAGRRQDLGSNGNLISQIMFNAQAMTNGGDGYLRIGTVHPSSGTLEVKTYSPYENTYLTDADNQFTIPMTASGIARTGTGGLRGRVYDFENSCARVAGATISIAGNTATSDTYGNYSISGITPGIYTLAISKAGYATWTAPVQIDDGLTASGKAFLTTGAAVQIAAPVQGSTVSSPLNVQAVLTPKSGYEISAYKVLLDGAEQTALGCTSGCGTNVNADVSAGSGSHTVEVRAYDTSSTTAFGTNSVSFIVGSSAPTTNQPPLVSLSVSPTSGTAPLAVTASTSGSSDPDGTIASSTINFGDGSATATATTASHTYSVAGTFTVTGTVTDNSGASSSATQTVTVNAAPVASCTAAGRNRSITICSPGAGSTVASPVSVSAAAKDSVAVTLMQVVLDGTTVYQAPNTKQVSTSITASPGSHQLTVRATDNKGSFSNTIAFTVH